MMPFQTNVSISPKKYDSINCRNVKTSKAFNASIQLALWILKPQAPTSLPSTNKLCSVRDTSSNR